MWATVTALTEAAVDQPPQVPSELIGILLSTLITGATAITVAIIQRNRRANTEATEPSRPFVIPEAEWIEVRNRSVRNETALSMLDRLYLGHVGESDATLSQIKEDIANLKGQLGIK